MSERPSLRNMVADAEARRERERAEQAASEIPQQGPVYYQEYAPMQRQPVIVQRGPEPRRQAQPQPTPLNLLDRWGRSVYGQSGPQPKKRRH